MVPRAANRGITAVAGAACAALDTATAGCKRRRSLAAIDTEERIVRIAPLRRRDLRRRCGCRSRRGDSTGDRQPRAQPRRDLRQLPRHQRRRASAISPSLAGRPKDDIVRKMQDFKAGRLPGTIMPQLAKGYTDAQIEPSPDGSRRRRGEVRSGDDACERRDFLRPSARRGVAALRRLRDDGRRARAARSWSSAAATAARRRPSTCGCGATARSTSTLVEPDAEFVSCPLSNLVLGGSRDARRHHA